jgi:PAS domain-containing protein
MTAKQNNRRDGGLEPTTSTGPGDAKDDRIRELEARVAKLDRAERDPREHECRFRAVFENAADAILLTDPTGPGCVLEANPAACRMFGYSQQEFRDLARADLVETADPVVIALLKHRLKDIFLVAVSGYSLPEDLQRATEAGFQRHLCKPPRIEKVEEILAEAGASKDSSS